MEFNRETPCVFWKSKQRRSKKASESKPEVPREIKAAEEEKERDIREEMLDAAMVRKWVGIDVNLLNGSIGTTYRWRDKRMRRNPMHLPCTCGFSTFCF